MYSLDIIHVIDYNNGVQYPQRRGGVGPVGWNTYGFFKLQVWYGHYAILDLSKGRDQNPCIQMERRGGARGLE